MNVAYMKSARGLRLTNLEAFRAVPDDAVVFQLAKLGNLDAIRVLFAHGEASLLDTDSQGWTPLAWAGILIILGIGYGLLLNAQNFTKQAICQPKDEASATAMYAFMRSFGMAVGVSIGGSMFQTVMKTKLGQFGLPTEIADDSVYYRTILCLKHKCSKRM